jgi:hypothetical protein
LKSKAPAKASLLLERTSARIFPIDNLMREREREEKKNSQKMLNSSTMNHLLVHAQCNRANRYLFHDRLINIELAAKKQTNWVFAFHWLLFGFYRGGFKNRVSEKNLCIHHLRRIELKLYYYMAILY